jgi:FdrA protein
MIDRVLVRHGVYHDSVTLMRVSRDVQAREDVAAAIVVSATPLNRDLVAEQGFDLPNGLAPDDLLVAIRTRSEAAADEAEAEVGRWLAERVADESASPDRPAPRSFTAAARQDPDLSLAVVSVPGDHAAYEVATAIEAGLHVFCFSSGIGVADEARLKRRAAARGLLLMGSDCGTAIIDGIGLGFANVVAPGPVGIVAASGTGTQEVVSLLDQAGVGISHAIGVGGRDLSREIGGTMTRAALDLLARDDETEVQIVVSKPPDAAVAARVAEAAAASGRPTVLAFLGLEEELDIPGGVEVAPSLVEAVGLACMRVGAQPPPTTPEAPASGRPGYLRGLFSGGTLCVEAMLAASASIGPIASNVPPPGGRRLRDAGSSERHTFIDFGEEEFTRGRPHPMIDPSLRNQRLAREAADPEVGAVLADVVLGRGAHPDPAAELAPIVREALGRGSPPGVIVALCGTGADPQGLEEQAAALAEAGAQVTRSSAHAGWLAARAVGGDA